MHTNPLLVPTAVGAALLFLLGLVLQKGVRGNPGRVVLCISAALFAVPGLLYVLYYTHLIDGAAWFYRLRTVRNTELMACGLGLALGMLHAWWEPESFGEKAAAPAVLFALVLVPFVKPVLDPLDLSKLKNHWEGDVCMQSTHSTCGPASAATLARSFGIDFSERELASDSFTSRGGTEIWYLARALQSRGIESRVMIGRPGQTTIPSPAIAGVVLPGNAGHFIAILNDDGQRVTIADPMKGKSIVSREDLPKYYRFTGFFLVLRRPTKSADSGE